MKRVLHLVEYLYQGGIERLLEQVARHTPRETASLCFFAYQVPAKDAGIARELEASGVPLYTYDKRAGYDLKLLAELIRVVEFHGIEAIHTHDYGPMEYAVALKLRFPRLQLVHTHHSVHYFLRFKRYIALFQLYSQFYSKIICVSDYVREQLASHCPLSRRKLCTIYNGVDLEAFAAPEPLKVQSPLRLVSVSRISPEKNLRHTLKALSRLRDAGIDFVFHHAGSGDPAEEKKIAKLIERHELKDKVHFHGFLADVRPLLAKGDIFISSSLTEGHPVAVLEAMAGGKLCLVSDIPAHRLLSNEALVFFPLRGNALFERLRAIARSPKDYIAVAEKARAEVSEKFSLARMLQAYAAVYT